MDLKGTGYCVKLFEGKVFAIALSDVNCTVTIQNEYMAKIKYLIFKISFQIIVCCIF